MTIFFPVSPVEDESLAGLVARAAGANIYPHARDVLALAGLGAIRPETIATKNSETAEDLAEVLGTAAGTLRPLYHAKIDESRIDFFGTPLRAKHRETRRRRVSPRALQDKAYIRAIWSIRPLSFDPQTKETLISNCPVCGGQLGFTRTWRVECCEHCVGADADGLPLPTVDLRDFPQTLVEVEDGEGLDFAVSLINPAKKDASRHVLHEDIASLGNGELFELVMAISDAFVAEERAIIPVWPSGRLVADEVHPAAIAAAGRCLLSWPEGLTALCASASTLASTRQGDWGFNKEFGAFARLRLDPHLHETTKRVIGRRLDAALSDIRPNQAVPRKSTRWSPAGQNYIGVRQLLKLAPVSSKITARMVANESLLKHRPSTGHMAPVLFNTWQALNVLDHYMDLVGEANVGATLGLPPDAIRDLCEIGIINDLPGPARSTAIELAGGGGHYSKASTDEFVATMVQGLPFRKPQKGYVSFLDVMLMFPTGHRPWLPVLMAVFFNRVDAVLHRNVAAQPKPRNLVGSISLRGIEQQRDRILQEHREAKEHDIGRISAVAANLMLGIYNHRVFMALADEKLIDVDGRGAADYRSVLDFASRFVFANEAAVRSRVNPRAFGAWAEAHGLKPAYSFPVSGGLIYDRAAVEQWLEMKA